jgi:hypothetical protein
MAVRFGTDPDLDPGRWKRERTNAVECRCIFDPLIVGVDVLEAAPTPPAGDPRGRTIGTAQAVHRARTA